MGDIADMIIEGVLCERCGVFIDEFPPGHPRLCVDCKLEDDEEEDTV